MHLIVKVPFHGYELGQRITDPEVVASILKGDKTHLDGHVLKIREDAHGWQPTAFSVEQPYAAAPESPFGINAPSA